MPTHKDIASRHQHHLESFANGEVKRFIPFLNRAVKGLREELLKTNTVTSQARIKAKLDFIENLIEAEFNGFTEQLTKNIDLFAVEEAAFAAETMFIADNVSLVLPSPHQLQAAVNARPFNNRLLKDYLKAFSKEQAAMVRNAVSMGFFEGKTTQEIIREIVGTKSAQFKDGILNVSRTSAERMVRTSLNHTASTARDKLYQDNIDIVPFYEWVSTLDGRTSNICKKLDGEVFKVGKGRMPPAHHNCRSTTAPLLRDEVNIKSMTKKDIGGRRSSVDGTVSADLNYNDWLKKQSKAMQIDALGVQRAELFRKGGLSVDKFTNDADQTLTLDQLRAKHPVAWGKT